MHDCSTTRPKTTPRGLDSLDDQVSDGELRHLLWPVSCSELQALYAQRVRLVSASALAVIAVLRDVHGQLIEQREIARRAALAARRPVGVATVHRVLEQLRRAGVLISEGGHFVWQLGRATCQRHRLRGCEALLAITDDSRRARLAAYRQLRRLGRSHLDARNAIRDRRTWRSRVDAMVTLARARTVATPAQVERRSESVATCAVAGVVVRRTVAAEASLASLLGAGAIVPPTPPLLTSDVERIPWVSVPETRSTGGAGGDSPAGLSTASPRRPQRCRRRRDVDLVVARERIASEAAQLGARDPHREADMVIGRALRTHVPVDFAGEVAVRVMRECRLDGLRLRNRVAYAMTLVHRQLAEAAA